MRTIVNFILDETGSMESCKAATISGFNEYIQTLKNKKEKILFSLTRFNSEKIDVVYKAEPIENVKELANYKPDALTPLYDAIGSTVTKVSAELKSKKKSKKKEKTKVLCVIMTDGEENASKEYTRKKIFDLVKEKEKENWTFIYLGANQDAYAESGAMGLTRDNTMNYSTANTKGVMSAMSTATASYASSNTVNCGAFFTDHYNKDDEKIGTTKGDN